MKLPTRLLTAALACAALVTLPAFADEAIKVEDPHVRLVPTGTPNTGAFMVIKNVSNADRKVVKAESPVSKVVELHNHINDNGVMRMRPVPDIDIKAKGEAVLKPGSLHVMLIGLKQDLKEGDVVPITLKLDDGSSTKIEAPVRKIQVQAAKPEDMGHQGHGAMKH
ncbi:transporter [Azospira sp. I13]|jgi:copper(I)-binding protein|uniref:copper chaperone PCu(A)C n=1 Tax=Azospira sp. I13 TaxID=1765050 RepID=UPI000D4A88FA|nr:copper chaperone PCu(A)C [Azospira sp. I13]GBG00824.1 transporter [Azospira sp. I13]